MFPESFIVPFMEEEDDTLNTALKTTFAIASVGIATLNMLETLLPAAAGEVEHESKKLSQNFTTIINYINNQGTAVPVEVKEAISGIIMGMQFQDRNTQIMENTASILERYRSMLEEICANIGHLHDNPDSAGHTVNQAVEGILSSIRLSEIRSRYLEALKKAKVHSGETGDAQGDKLTKEDGIEIF